MLKSRDNLAHKESAPEQPRDLLTLKKELDTALVSGLEKLGRHSQMAIVARLFEHSPEDALPYLRKIQATPAEIGRIVGNTPVILKHQELTRQLVREPNMSLLSEDSLRILNAYGKKEGRIWNHDGTRAKSQTELKRDARNDLAMITEYKAGTGEDDKPFKLLMRKIDDYYGELLRLRSFKGVETQSSKPSDIKLGEIALEQARVAIAPHYYSGPIVDFVKKRKSKKKKADIDTIVPRKRYLSEDEIKAIKKKLALSALDEEAEKFDHLVARSRYRPLATMEAIRFAETEKQLADSIKKELARDYPEMELVKESLRAVSIIRPKETVDGEKIESKEIETGYISDEKASAELRKMLDKNPNISASVAQGLAGIDTKEAWDMRREILKTNPGLYGFVAEGLAGLDTKEAWDMRREIMKIALGFSSSVAQGLAGIDTKEAWDMRREILKTNPGLYGFVAEGLAGLDTKEAWDMRREIMKIALGFSSSVALGLAGIDTKEAWDMRREIMKTYPGLYGFVAQGLAGIDTKEAWDMRREIMKIALGFSSFVAQGLAGLDTKEAWDMRREIMKTYPGLY